jgi:hypothetical protein
MRESGSRTLVILISGLVALALLLFFRPEYLASPQFLGAAIATQILLFSLAQYRDWFFVVLMAGFVWAGIDLPSSGAWLQGRWIVLAIGAIAGLAIYMRDPNHRFSLIHMLAFSCVLSAVVSASVSAYPQEALLKSLSLFLLFLYGVTGARLAVPLLQPQEFFRKLLVGCEVITYATAVAYFLLRWSIFGNPSPAVGIIVCGIDNDQTPHGAQPWLVHSTFDEYVCAGGNCRCRGRMFSGVHRNAALSPDCPRNGCLRCDRGPHSFIDSATYRDDRGQASPVDQFAIPVQRQAHRRFNGIT